MSVSPLVFFRRESWPRRRKDLRSSWGRPGTATSEPRRCASTTPGGGGRRRVALDAVVDSFEGQRLEVVAVQEALDRPAEPDGRQARVMTLRYFGEMTVAEVAAPLGVSVTTVAQDWRLARAWLAGQLGGGHR